MGLRAHARRRRSPHGPHGPRSPRYRLMGLTPHARRRHRNSLAGSSPLAPRRQRDLRELLVQAHALGGVVAGGAGEAAEAHRVDLLHHPEARLVAHVLLNSILARRSVENERMLAVGEAAWVEAVEQPDARVDREFLLLGIEAQVVAVRDAGAVGEN